MKFKVVVSNMSKNIDIVNYYELPNSLNEKAHELIEKRIDSILETVEIVEFEDYGVILEFGNIRAYSVDDFFHQIRLGRIKE